MTTIEYSMAAITANLDACERLRRVEAEKVAALIAADADAAAASEAASNAEAVAYESMMFYLYSIAAANLMHLAIY